MDQQQSVKNSGDQSVALKTAIPSPHPVVKAPAIVEETPINKRAAKPLRKTGNSSFSIKKRVEEEKSADDLPDEEILRTDLPREDFTQAQVSDFWNKFLEKLKVEHNIPAHNALASTEILVNNHEIVFEFVSQSSESEFDLYKNRIRNGLRNHLNNHYFTIRIQLSEKEVQNHILSNKEKFDRLLEKNPTLLRLKEEFGLDLFD